METDYVYKIIAIGDGGVGKTSIIRRFADDKFDKDYVMTLGVDFSTKKVNLADNTSVKILCVDTAGQEFFDKIRPTYFDGGQGTLVVFDLCNRNSFNSLSKWISEIQEYLPDIPVAIVGNKIDLAKESDARRVQIEEGEKFAKQHNNIKYFETSAKEGDKINLIFEYLSQIIYDRILQEKH